MSPSHVVLLPPTRLWYWIQETFITAILPWMDKSFSFVILLSTHQASLRLDSLTNITSGARGLIWRAHTEEEKSCIKWWFVNTSKERICFAALKDSDRRLPDSYTTDPLSNLKGGPWSHSILRRLHDNPKLVSHLQDVRAEKQETVYMSLSPTESTQSYVQNQ